jgi:hypothetical protein
MSVADAIAEARVVAEALAADFPDLADDERAWIDTLSGVTDALDVADRLIRRTLHVRALIAGCKQEIAEITARKERFQRQDERLTAAAQAIVTAACPPDGKGRVRIEQPRYTASLAHVPPRLIITDQDALPKHLLRVTVEPDKNAIIKALRAQASAVEALPRDATPEQIDAVLAEYPDTPGAALSNGGTTLRISTK